MKYGKIYTEKNYQEARHLIGKEVLCSNSLFILEDMPGKGNIATLIAVSESLTSHPFYVGLYTYRYIREIKEQDA